MSILDKVLSKRGIKDPSELDNDERATFDEWRAILSKEELTIEDIKDFCGTQCEIIETKWKDYGIEQSRKSELLPYFTVYKTLLSAIESPKVAREALEKYLTQLIQ